MKKILVIGSLNMDFAVNVAKTPVRGETVLAESMNLIPGGKGANQAFAAGRLGGNVTMLGAVGNDSYGQMLTENLKKAGVETKYLKVTDKAGTGIALVMVDGTGDNRIIVIQGANALVDIPYIESCREVIAESDIVIFQLEIPVETVTYAAKLAKEMGKTVILDPAPAKNDLPDELLSQLDLVKPNEHEIYTLINREENIPLEEAIREAQAKGVKNVLVTLGGDGSVYFAGNGEKIRIPAKKVKVVDTTGAGDSYTAALAVKLAEDHSMKDAMEFANKVGALVTTKKGAQTSIPSRAEADAFQ